MSNGRRNGQSDRIKLEPVHPDGRCYPVRAPCERPALPGRWCCAEHAEELELRAAQIANGREHRL